MLLHPIILQFGASRLKLPPGGFHALLAAATLLVPQILAIRLAANRRAAPAWGRSLGGTRITHTHAKRGY